MSALLIAASIAVGTTFALLSLAYLAAASAYRGQALQDEEAAKLWTRVRKQPQPIAPAVVALSPRRRAPVPASCSAIGKAPERGAALDHGRPRRHARRRPAVGST
jgi:hypothetical protein